MANTSLSLFLQQLFTDGIVTISGKIESFEINDLEESKKLLQSFYNEDILGMPGTAPGFETDAALWAARYLYIALQLTVIREIEAEKLPELIEEFDGPITSESIYSADLILRHLPSVFHLAKGLAPKDAVVQLFQQAAKQWPFSSVGIDVGDSLNETIILQHASLRIAYADRIIQQKDIKRIQQNSEVKAAVKEVIGSYTETFWPKFTFQESLPQT